MYKFPAKYLIAFLFIIVSNVSFAQTTTSYSNPLSLRENNPYSKYGIGELWNGNSTALQGMGNITSAYADPFMVNSDNPASYSSLLWTTFQGGAIASFRNITNSAGASYTTGTASISYLNLGVPITKRNGKPLGGMSLGLRPYSHTYYALLDTTLTQLGRTERSYAGDGGLSYAYIGASVIPVKGLSIGFNLGYMFGTFRNFTSTNYIYDTTVINRSYEAQFANYTRVGGLYWKGGVSYEHIIKKDTNLVFRIGGTLALGQNLAEHVSNYQISIFNFGDTLVNDTSKSISEQKGKLRMPVTYSIGAVIAKSNKWTVGVDYQMTDWSNFSSTPDSTRTLGVGASSYKLSVGGEYTPNFNELHNYFSRVTYRLGFYYGTDYVKLQNTVLPAYGITFGGSFPYKRNFRSPSRISASFDIGRLGTQTNNLLQQTYVRFGFGMTFNDKWFNHKKYD